MSDHEELESSVAAWVLGALDPDEAEAIRTHVEACPTCREVAARLRRVVGALPLVVEGLMSLFNAHSARPNWVTPSPPAASLRFTRKMPCLSL